MKLKHFKKSLNHLEKKKIKPFLHMHAININKKITFTKLINICRNNTGYLRIAKINKQTEM